VPGNDSVRRIDIVVEKCRFGSGTYVQRGSNGEKEKYPDHRAKDKGASTIFRRGLQCFPVEHSAIMYQKGFPSGKRASLVLRCRNTADGLLQVPKLLFARWTSGIARSPLAMPNALDLEINAFSNRQMPVNY